MVAGGRSCVGLVLLVLLALVSVDVEAIRICGRHPRGRGHHPPGVGRHRNRTSCIDLNYATRNAPSVVTISATLAPGFAPEPSPSQANETTTAPPSNTPLSLEILPFSPPETPLSSPSEAPLASPPEVVPLASPSEAPLSSPPEVAPLSSPSEAPLATPAESAPLSSYLPEAAKSPPAEFSRSPPPPREFPPGAQPPSYTRTVEPPPAQSFALPMSSPSFRLLCASFLLAVLLSFFQ